MGSPVSFEGGVTLTAGFAGGTLGGFNGATLAGDPLIDWPGIALVLLGDVCFGWPEAAVTCVELGVLIGTAAGTRCVPDTGGA